MPRLASLFQLFLARLDSIHFGPICKIAGHREVNAGYTYAISLHYGICQEKGPEKFPARKLFFESGAPPWGAPFLLLLIADARVVELRSLEFRTRAVADRAGFLPVRQAAASHTQRIAAGGADDRALQVINLAALGLEVSFGRRACMAYAADRSVRCRGDVVAPDPDVRSLVGANRPGRRAGRVVQTR